MTYYEELGLPAGASREEIRQAYKHLVRLLHPDQCSEDSTRRLADLQMKRLNAILSVLMDPEARAAYDCSLLATPPAVKRPDPVLWYRDPRWRRPAIAIAAVLVVLIFCAVFPLHPPAPQVQAAPACKPSAAVPQPKTVRHAASHNAPPRSIHADEESPPEALPRYHAASAEPRAAAETATPTASVPVRSAELPVPRPAPTIAGEWLFVASPSIKNTGYPPEYIELRVSDDHGTIRGRYRARYRVADRAISPNVVFQFEGRTAPEGGLLPWRGAGGSQGEITLHLLANGDLDVEWAADQMGEELGLISGKARLVRKLE